MGTDNMHQSITVQKHIGPKMANAINHSPNHTCFQINMQNFKLNKFNEFIFTINDHDFQVRSMMQ